MLQRHHRGRSGPSPRVSVRLVVPATGRYGLLAALILGEAVERAASPGRGVTAEWWTNTGQRVRRPGGGVDLRQRVKPGPGGRPERLCAVPDRVEPHQVRARPGLDLGDAHFSRAGGAGHALGGCLYRVSVTGDGAVQKRVQERLGCLGGFGEGAATLQAEN